jgi:outer membrane protein insertion porin family
MLHSRPLAAPFLCLLAFAASAFGQQVTLSQIKFVGDDTHTQAQLFAASGLKFGPSTVQAVQDATQRLGDTGMFESVNFATNGSELTFTLKPAASKTMLPARFTNFLWWDDKDLNAVLAKQIPLYRSDAVPIDGNLRDAISAALKDLVAAKGVPTPSVTSIPSAPQPGNPPSIAFSIATPRVIVRSVHLDQASPALLSKLQPVLAELSNQPWDSIHFLDFVDSRVGDTYRNNGYLDVAISNLQHSEPAVTGDTIGLDVTASVNEGPVYRVSQLNWPGTPVLSSGDFLKQSLLKPGAVASVNDLHLTLHAIEVAYSAQGYIAAKVDAPPQLDRTARLVSYSFSVAPGAQYHVKSIQWSGLPPDQQQALASQFRIKPGDIYDATYFLNFVRQHADLLRQGYRPGINTRANPADHTVDLTLVFSKGQTPPPPPQ